MVAPRPCLKNEKQQKQKRKGKKGKQTDKRARAGGSIAQAIRHVKCEHWAQLPVLQNKNKKRQCIQETQI
jgi:hypothetical protein